jgi:hypothetical protein
MKQQAQRSIATGFTWQDYGQRYLHFLSSLV